MDSLEPILQYCIFCDNISRGARGKPVFIGVFDVLSRPETVPQFYVVLRWIVGMGEHTSSIRILDPDLEPIFTSKKTEMLLAHKAQPSEAVHSFVNFQFPNAGVYWIEILLNGKTYTAIPLPVHKAEEPKPDQ